MSLLDELSPYLRGVLTQHCYGPAIKSVPFFNINFTGLSERDLRDAEAESNFFMLQVRVLHRM